MTERLLWFGQVIRKTGKVKSKSGDFAKSDWMELEKQRGISISTSVMSFEYNQRAMHLLDTPGHKDFSEDTYRTLTAVESVLMMIDSAKGVETQTIKLIEVCRMRDTPIITFMNKFDRDALDPFELLDNVEKICSIQCIPMTWPVGDGVNFKGVYDLAKKQIVRFKDDSDPFNPEILNAQDLSDAHLIKIFGEDLMAKLAHDVQMIAELIPPLNREEFLNGIQTPVYFGSALHNFGVKEVLDEISGYAPGPRAKNVLIEPFEKKQEKQVLPSDQAFTGFIFKIQANMDKRHRDRMAFLRICSGEFTRNQLVFHVRSQKEFRIPTPMFFQADEREVLDKAYPGDIIGLYDAGKYQIGDTLTQGENIRFTGIPHFAPEFFMRPELKEPLKAKALEKGLKQLSEEGAVQLFSKKFDQGKILGAVGMLQFEVVKFRLEDEYNVKADYATVPYQGVRWLVFNDPKIQDKFLMDYSSFILSDSKDRLCFAVRSEWDLKLAVEKNPEVSFNKTSEVI
jgi:peptide chain release factor 3